MPIRRLIAVITCFWGALVCITPSALSQSAPFANDTPAPPSRTQSLELNVLAASRLRYQSLEQENFAQTAHALTFNTRIGVELDVDSIFSVLGELEGSYQLIDDYNDTLNTRFDRPVIPDVESFELNRFQVQTEIIPSTRLTLGRQYMALDNWRFLGQWHFRQNDQTFDGLRAESNIGPGRLDIGYFNRVHRHFGENSPIGTFKGDSFFLNYGVQTSIGRVTFFNYAFDLNIDAATQPDAFLSSLTRGVRWQARRHWQDMGVIWDASYAVQTDYKDNISDYAAEYKALSLTLLWDDFGLELEAEQLGSDNGFGLQTPLSSPHIFQGVTDRFLQTPPDGVRDYAAKLTYEVGAFGPFERVKAAVGAHHFTSDARVRDYGREVNFVLSGEYKDTLLSLEIGEYSARDGQFDGQPFASDARTFIISASYSFD